MRHSDEMPLQVGVVTVARLALLDAQNPAALGGDHALMPGRIPNDLDAGVLDVGEHEDLLLGIARDGGAHAAAGGGEGHLDEDLSLAAGEKINAHVVDQAEVDDIDGDFRVVTGAEGFPDHFLIHGIPDGSGGGRSGFGLESEGIGVGRTDAEQTALGMHSVGTAQGLGDVHFRTGGQGDDMARRDLDGLAIAAQRDSGDSVHRAQKLAGKGIQTNFVPSRDTIRPVPLRPLVFERGIRLWKGDLSG